MKKHIEVQLGQVLWHLSQVITDFINIITKIAFQMTMQNENAYKYNTEWPGALIPYSQENAYTVYTVVSRADA